MFSIIGNSYGFRYKYQDPSRYKCVQISEYAEMIMTLRFKGADREMLLNAPTSLMLSEKDKERQDEIINDAFDFPFIKDRTRTIFEFSLKWYDKCNEK